jgi:acyl-CoA thioesterase-1
MKGKVIWMAGTVIALLSLFGVCQGVSEAGSIEKREQSTSTGTIVALGDSLTAGYGVKGKDTYPVRLEKKLRETGFQWRVINAGVCGETSGDILSRIDSVLTLKPDIVILEIGVNDGFQGIDPQVTRNNIDETVRIFKAHRVTVILAGMRMFTNPESDFSKSFAAIYPDIARQHDIILIPFFLAGVAGDPSLNKADGIHPVAKGYQIVTETVYPYLRRALDRKNRGKEHL